MSRRPHRKAGIYWPKVFGRWPIVAAGMSLRCLDEDGEFSMSMGGGDDAVRGARNRQTLTEAVGFDPSRLITQRQVHGDAVRIVPSLIGDAVSDAMVCVEPGWLVGVTVADCIPVLLYDTIGNVIGAVHSGWRGSAQNIVAAAVAAMHGAAGSRPEDIVAFVGAGAAVCCYEVGPEVAGQFPSRHRHELPGGGFLLDNRGIVVGQLIDSGLRPGNIEVDMRCTICDEQFHSYRRDGVRSGRMLAVIGLRQVDHPGGETPADPHEI